ncbi:hypothetical protein [Mucilaginibacter gracilis]|nr:hypothetical protein [Mucilaginibacter gracilis]
MDKDYWLKLLESGDALEILQRYSEFKNQVFADEIIEKTVRYAAEKEPGTALYFADIYKKQFYANKVIERAVRNQVKEYPEGVLLGGDLYIDKPYAKEILFAACEKGSLAVLQHTELYIDKPYAKELISKASYNVFSDKNQVLELLQNINSLHDSPENVRFAILPFLTPGQKYDLITKGREEIYTSSYLTIVDSLFVDVKKKHQSLDKLLSPEQMQSMGIFLEAAASYNRIDPALRCISNAAFPGIMQSIITQCADHTKGMESAATLATIISSQSQNITLRKTLEEGFHKGYDQAIVDKESRHQYGLLASLYTCTYRDTVIPGQKAFFDKIMGIALYHIPALDTLNQSKLTDKNGVCNQLMVFASDDDSKKSYENWKKEYHGLPGWETVEYNQYTVIKKTDGKVPVSIYANKPEAGTDGIKDIEQVVRKQQDSVQASFQVFIGRGHSYHANEYLSHLSNKTSLVYLGSCGGYNNLSRVLQVDPTAQVIATRERGSMYVNDPLLLNLNRSINEAGKINWHEEDQKLQKIPSADKTGYLMPNKNMGLELLQYYDRIKDEPTISFDAAPSASKPPSPHVNRHKSISH